ncbi:MAG: DUF192 domain-containing protein [Candidatus Levybacteria bacterium]|nr:DUF192 domain-containing protein [Candidatus Levybacteria bacterium]
MKNLLIIVGLLILLAIAFFFTQNALTGNTLNIFSKSAKALIGGQTFTLMVADTEREKGIGLSEKKSLAKNSGMIFPYDKKTTPTFWMRNMDFPIDILFVSDGKIVTLYKNVKPPTGNQNLELYRPKVPIDSVIEIGGGVSDQYKVKEGDSVQVTL